MSEGQKIIYLGAEKRWHCHQIFIGPLYSQCALKIHNLLRQTRHRFAPSARSADTVGLSVWASGCGSGIQKDGGCLCAVWPNTGYDSGKQAQLRLNNIKKGKSNEKNLKECKCQGVNTRGTIETAFSSPMALGSTVSKVSFPATK